MFTRIASVFLAAVLTIPAIPLTRLDEAGPSPWGNVTVAAKGKPHHGHKPKKRKKHDQAQVPTTVTRTVRQSVTKTFTSTESIAIPSGAPATDEGPASPYPSAIDVSGFTNGTITDVNLILNDFTHSFSADTDFLISTGDGRRALVMSDVGDNPVLNVDLTLDDEAAAPLPDSQLSSGTFQPADIDFNEVDDSFAAPSPAPDGSVGLSTFDGADPNETWQLWVMDDDKGDSGAIGGWALEITAEVDVQVQEPAPVPDEHKGKQHHKQVQDQPGARRREG